MAAHAIPSGVYAGEAVAEIRKAARLPIFFLPSIFTPPAFYALFALALGRGDAQMATYSLATFGVFAAIGPALFGFGAGVAQEREAGQLALKRLAPMPAGAHLFGKLAACLLFTACALALLYPLGLLASVRLEPWRWAMLFVVQLLSVVPFALIGLGLGYRAGSKGAVALANMLFLGFAVLGGLWVPIDAFPAWMKAAAWTMPSYHMGELALHAAGIARKGAVMVHVALIAAITLAAGAFAWTGLRKPAS